jgi:lipopolysaccharide transport system ATP-binding protein
MSDTLIKVEGTSKKFCRSLKQSLLYGMYDLGNELIGRRSRMGSQVRENEFWAVKDVSFEVRQGECLGLIGPNGSGKTTILRMLNGLIKPDRGKITVCGRVGALIALGTGFNPILTGKENVYAAGAVLGLTTKEIKQKYYDIVEFAELEEFMDTPVQHYSSGMHVRLGFAVAAQMEPDILILDEVLAVGDEAFQRKCFRSLEIFRDKGGTVLLVTHNTNMIATYCDRALLLDHGRRLHFGEPSSVIAAYRKISSASKFKDKSVQDGCHVVAAGTKLEPPHFITQSGDSVHELVHGNHYKLKCVAQLSVAAQELQVTAHVRLRNGYIIGTASSDLLMGQVSAGPGDTVCLKSEFMCLLLPGVYVLDCYIEGDCIDGRKLLGQVSDLLFRVESGLNLIGVGAINFSLPHKV